MSSFERRPHSTDRRATLVTLTERGRTIASGWQAGYRELAERLFAEVDPAEIAVFVASLDHVLDGLRDQHPSSPAR